MFFRKTPFLIRKLFPEITWRIEDTSKVFLTFDDGPNPSSTPSLLNLLDKHNIAATFFLLGEQMDKYPELVALIRDNGHVIGFHGQKHLSGWKTSTSTYHKNSQHNWVSTNLFRPPFGRLKLSQYNSIKKSKKIVMWDLMPGDFLENVTGPDCFDIICKYIQGGSIVALHDNSKTYEKFEFMIPALCEMAKKEGFAFAALTDANLGS